MHEYRDVDPGNKTIEIHTIAENGYAPSGKFMKNERVKSPYFDGLGFAADEAFG